MAASAPLPVANPLPAERFFRISLFLLLLTAILTLIGTGKIDLFTSITATAALLYRARRWWYGHEPELNSRTATLLVLCYVAFFPVDIFFISHSLAANSPNPPLYSALISSVHFLIFVMLVRMFSARTDRDAHFLVMLAFAAVLASAVLTVDTTFLFLFFMFLLFAVATYAGLELRRGAVGAFVPPSASMPDSERKLARALVLAAISVSVGAIICGAILFFLLPRVSAGYMGKTSFNPTLLSGFSDQVELGQIGQIKKSSAVVLRVETGAPIDYPALRWRGNALSNFDGRRWSSTEPGGPKTLLASTDGWIALSDRTKPGESRGAILQFTVLQEPMASDALFFAGNALAIHGNFTGEGASRRRSSLLRDSTGSLTNPYHNFVSIRYTAISQLPQLDRARLEAAGTDYPPAIRDTDLQLPANLDSRIPALARTATVRAANPYDQAALLEAFLKTKYSYTLDLTAIPGKDPLAYFLFETRAGHCEYFASAMTVMLRTLGIPAREVNGFLPGEYNDLGGDYIVRASDAHSWVEVYFPGMDWQTFDPTPAAPANETGFLTRLGQFADWMEITWSEWVIGYDFAHQLVLAQNLQRDSRNWNESARNWFERKQRAAKRWMKSWQLQRGVLGYLLPVALVLFLAALRFNLLTELGRRVRLFFQLRGSKVVRADPQLASRLYAELLRMLARRGLMRSVSQTPFEFAAAVDSPNLAPAVREFTQLYGQARFGGAPCDTTRLRQLLDQIRTALRGR